MLAALQLLAACGGSDKPEVIAPPVTTGVERWSYTTTGELRPRDGSNLLVAQVGFTSINGISAATGQQTWTKALPTGNLSVFPAGGLVISSRSIGAGFAATFFDGANGDELWTSPETPRPVKLLFVLGSTVILQASDTSVAAYDRTSGREKWRSSLASVSCVGRAFCNFLQPIGVDGNAAYLLRRSEGEARLITLSENGIVREVVSPAPALLAVFNERRQTAVVRGSGSVAVWSQLSGVAAVDVVTGAERWRTSYSSLNLASSAQSSPYESWFAPDGALLLLRFASETGAEQRVVSMATGTLLTQRTFTRMQLIPDLFSGCGNEGYVQASSLGLEYTNLRTGAVRQVVRAGLLDTIIAAGITAMEPLSTDRVLLSGPGVAIGVTCAN
jgi:outer membrane protein assembly factor BamB